MILNPFQGSGSTDTRRKFWDEVRLAVIASQKIQGKNVSVSEHVGKGTIIDVNRSPSSGVSPTCVLPDSGICKHALCFDLKIEQAEIDANNAGDVVDFLGTGRDASNPLMGLFPVYGTGWTLFSDETSLTVNPTITAGEWFPVRIELRTDGSTPKIKLAVSGAVSSEGNATVAEITGFLAGANFSSGIHDHRSIRNIQLIANPDSAEEDFLFPPDSFDSVTGGAITVSAGLIVIDGDGNNYAIKNLDPAYGICTDCGEGTPTSDSTITVTISGVTSCGCTINSGGSGSVTISPSFDGDYVLPFREDLIGPIFEFIDNTAVVGSITEWTSNDCSGDSTTEDLVGIRIMLHYNTTDHLWTFFCDVGGGTTDPKLFEAIALITDCWGNGGTTFNQVGCSSPFGVFGTGGMTGGSITLNWV